MKPALAPEDLVRQRISENLELKQALLESTAFCSLVALAGMAIAEAVRRGHKVLFFGNGGSAADAQHLAAEFTGRFLHERQPLPGLALTTNTSSVTAIGNDYTFDHVFSRPLQALGSAGDVAVGISTSGNSPNVLCALEVARSKGMLTVGLCGASGGKMKPLVDFCLCIPSTVTPRIQEAHILAGHILCEIVEQQLLGERDVC